MSHWVQLGDGLPWEMELQMSPTEIPTFLLVPWGLWPDGMSSPSGKGGTVSQGKGEGSQLRQNVLGLEAVQATSLPLYPSGPPLGLFRPHSPATHSFGQLNEISFLT